MEFEYILDGALRKIALEKLESGWMIRDGDAAAPVEIRRISERELLLLSGDSAHRVILARDGDRLFVRLDGKEVLLIEPGESGGRSAGSESGGSGDGRRIIAPMPGKVIKVCVAPGEAVRKNQTLVIVEAMKMENEIKAASDGAVVKVHVAAGELVDAERTLVELEPAIAPKEAK
jgi:biotin carboxyl carrier protein